MTPVFNSHQPLALPEAHHSFLQTALPQLAADPRLVGVAAGGSLISGTMDEFSDLDLVIAVEPTLVDQVMQNRYPIAEQLGPLLTAFTGEHVNEPRLLICLYGPPLLHVDLKFVSLSDVAIRVEDPLILWERDGRLSAALQQGTAQYPLPNLQWIEDRFWIWIHYCAVKIGRGELLEAVDFLAVLRAQVLGPLSLMEQGARPWGVRKIEFCAPHRAAEMQQTIATYDPQSCLASLRIAVQLYQTLRAKYLPSLLVSTAAEAAVIEYLDQIEAGLATALSSH